MLLETVSSIKVLQVYRKQADTKSIEQWRYSQQWHNSYNHSNSHANLINPPIMFKTTEFRCSIYSCNKTEQQKWQLHGKVVNRSPVKFSNGHNPVGQKIIPQDSPDVISCLLIRKETRMKINKKRSWARTKRTKTTMRGDHCQRNPLPPPPPQPPQY